MNLFTCKHKLLLGIPLLVFILSGCKPSPAGLSPKPPETAPTYPAFSLTGTLPPGKIRPPAVAGSWYPGDPQELRSMVDDFLGKVKPVDGEPLALIVPHAGYQYSGPVAAYGFKQMAGVPYEVAVIIAADHQEPLAHPISVWAEGGFQTPLGVVPVDSSLAQELIAADPHITFDPAAHEGEHGIEIELPFLQQVCPGCKILPVLMGADDEQTVQVLAKALLSVLPGRRAVVIASSDLAHYPSYNDAYPVDNAVLGAIETGDPRLVRQTIDQVMAKGISNLVTCACGEGPILVTMQVAQGLGADAVTLLHHATSGDVPSADKSQVVGYGAVMFWHYQPPELTEAQQKELLSIARTAISEDMKTGRLPDYRTSDPALTRLSGVFVTLKEGGELRGCIGHLQADLPLYQAVQQMAVSAAFSDPRFPSLTTQEPEKVTLEISILSPFHRITSFDQIQIGTHGLLLSQEGARGIFLPQVPVEQGWNRQQYLENLCLKAGLASDCWTKNPTLYTFTALVFGEG
jgi:AmmeMemoRadiSam system protein B/AmmeMemoRadiSam system protein A